MEQHWWSNQSAFDVSAAIVGIYLRGRTIRLAHGCLRQRHRKLNSTSCTKKKTEEFKKKKDIVHDPGPQKRSPLDLHAWNRFYLFEGKSDQSIHKSSGRRVAFVRCQRTKGTILVSSTDSKHISTNRTATETRIFLWELATLSHTARASVADHK